jgi:hypothetical protein
LNLTDFHYSSLSRYHRAFTTTSYTFFKVSVPATYKLKVFIYLLNLLNIRITLHEKLLLVNIIDADSAIIHCSIRTSLPWPFQSCNWTQLVSLSRDKKCGNIRGETQSTYIYRAPQCMSPRWNWDSPTPLAASKCALPPDHRVGGHTRLLLKGWGESQFQRLEKRLALCLLCGGKGLW